MHLYERLKINVQGISQWLHPKDNFSGRFEDVRKMSLQNRKNMQQLTFKYFTQHIWWLGS